MRSLNVLILTNAFLFFIPLLPWGCWFLQVRTCEFQDHQVKERLSQESSISIMDVHVQVSGRKGIRLHEGVA